MRKFVSAAVVCAAILIGGAASGQSADEKGPVKPGSVRITTRAPEPGKWDLVSAQNGAQRLYRCKPLACPDPAQITFGKSPAAKIDPKALARYAEVELPKNLRAMAAARTVMSDVPEKIETLSSKPTTLKGYPAVVNETKFSHGATTSYIQIVIIFAGPAMIRVHSSSANRELSQKTLTEFLDIMQIVEGPPRPAAGVRSL
jgi:hypothetical protein